MNGLEQRKEECRDTRRVRRVEDRGGPALRRSHAVRSRGFTAAAIVTLALGIGASVAVFTVVNGVLLRPMPFPDPDRSSSSRTGARVLHRQPGLSDRQYPGVSARATGCSRTSRRSPGRAARASPRQAIHPSSGGSGLTTSSSPRCASRPATGRTFEAGDEQPGRDHVALRKRRHSGAAASARIRQSPTREHHPRRHPPHRRRRDAAGFQLPRSRRRSGRRWSIGPPRQFTACTRSSAG